MIGLLHVDLYTVLGRINWPQLSGQCGRLISITTTQTVAGQCQARLVTYRYKSYSSKP